MPFLTSLLKTNAVLGALPLRAQARASINALKVIQFMGAWLRMYDVLFTISLLGLQISNGVILKYVSANMNYSNKNYEYFH